MKKIIISILLTTTIFTLCSCGKTDNVQVSNEVIETAEQPEQEQETENIINDEPEQETEQEIDETVSVEIEEPEQDTETDEANQQEEIEIEALDKTMYASNGVNVREGDSTAFNVVGQLYTNQSVHVTGRSTTGWFRIDYGNDSAFVSDKYLSDNPVEVQQVEQAQQSSSTGSNSSNVGTDGLTPEARAWMESQGITPMTWDGTISQPHTGDVSGLSGITAE